MQQNLFGKKTDEPEPEEETDTNSGEDIDFDEGDHSSSCWTELNHREILDSKCYSYINLQLIKRSSLKGIKNEVYYSSESEIYGNNGCYSSGGDYDEVLRDNVLQY
jgi:hypothetical protein